MRRVGVVLAALALGGGAMWLASAGSGRFPGSVGSGPVAEIPAACAEDPETLLTGERALAIAARERDPATAGSVDAELADHSLGATSEVCAWRVTYHDVQAISSEGSCSIGDWIVVLDARTGDVYESRADDTGGGRDCAAP